MDMCVRCGTKESITWLEAGEGLLCRGCADELSARLTARGRSRGKGSGRPHGEGARCAKCGTVQDLRWYPGMEAHYCGTCQPASFK